MSPEGLTAAEFHARPGVGDWRVTSWGPQAFFRSSSLAHAARLVPAIVEAASRFGLDPDVDLREEGVVVRVPYRGAHRIPVGAADLASVVSLAAHGLGLTPDPALIQTVDIAVAQHPDVDTRPFQEIREGRAGRGRTHIDVSVPADQAQARVDAAVAAGGRIADDSYAPAWWTPASPDNHGVDVAALD